MKRLTLVMAIIGTVGCSGSSTPTSPSSPSSATTATVAPAPPPIAAANLITPAGGQISMPGCESLKSLSALLGLSTTSCKSFQGPLQNMGTGCAANVRGTLTIFRDSAGQQSMGSSEWFFLPTIRAGEQVTYIGGSVVIPTTGTWFWRSTPAWDNVRCQ